MKDEVWHALIVVITNAPELHGYTVRSLFKALPTSCEEVLNHLSNTAFCAQYSIW